MSAVPARYERTIGRGPIGALAIKIAGQPGQYEYTLTSSAHLGQKYRAVIIRRVGRWEAKVNGGRFGHDPVRVPVTSSSIEGVLWSVLCFVSYAVHVAVWKQVGAMEEEGLDYTTIP